jgi:hypothetical protein
VDVAHVVPELFGGEVVVLRVGAIGFDTIEHPFGLLLGEKCIFVWKTLDNFKRASEEAKWTEEDVHQKEMIPAKVVVAPYVVNIHCHPFRPRWPASCAIPPATTEEKPPTCIYC